MDDKASPLSELFGSEPRKSMADQLYNQLRDMISSGKLEEGYVFPNETEMCQRMHVGRSTLREAYQKLAIAGYITRTKRGTRVNGREKVLKATPLRIAVAESSIEEFREFRSMLEIQAVRLAAARTTTEDLAHLEALQRKLIAARKAKDVDLAMHLDKEFHLGIATATHNQLLVNAMLAVSSMWDSRVLGSFKRAAEKSPKAIDALTNDHRAILAALKAKDEKAVQRAMRKHIKRIST